MGPRILHAAQAMPAAKYGERLAAGEPTFGESVATIANYSSLYCSRLTGSRDLAPGSDETQRRDSIVTHLQAKLTFCRTALATFGDSSLADTVRFDGVKTKAALTQELVVFLATRYEYLTEVMREQGLVPPSPPTDTPLVVASRGGSHQTSAVAKAFRDKAGEIAENVLLASELMPADKYSFKATGVGASFASVALGLARMNDDYCSALGGARRPPRPEIRQTAAKTVIVAHLRKTAAYCASELAKLDDSHLDELMPGPRRTRAAVMTAAIADWAIHHRRLASALRLNGFVPPTACTIGGNGGCDSGVWACRATGGPTVRGGTFILSDSAYSVKSDGKGPYRHGENNSQVVLGAVANLEFFVRPPATQSLRSVTIDLDHPVPGDIGSPLGVITADTNLELTTQWYTESDYTQHNLLDIPIGSTVQAKQMNVAFHINGVPHALQMGPQPLGHCTSDGSSMYGDGTTMGTISRPQANQWVVDLPVGSIGRLFDVHLREPNAVDKGLYFTSLHYVIQK